ncbi:MULTISPECIES: putative glycoside hydrolase [Kribbella]|uniref:Glycosyl hydrolase-like family 15 (GHL15) protein n=1 Tax=Kribbella karoonensis TaxID=324851 RepID=A0ABN2D1H6_9ACTN
MRLRRMSSAAVIVAVGLGMLTTTAQAAEPDSAGGSCPPPASGVPLPVTRDHGVLQAQVFDRQVPDPSVYAGRVGFVWGALKAAQPAGVLASSYVTAFRNAPARQYTPEWFRTNHPDWIEYTADRTTPAWEFNNQVYTPIDISNPEVRQWFTTNLIDPALAAGFTTIAVDNIGVRNDFHVSGHYDKDGNWVQQFGADPKDPAWVADVLDWLRYLRDYAHAHGASVAFNLTFNGSLHDEFQDKSPEYLAALDQMIDISDIWLNEQGFTVHRVENVVDDEWQIMFDLLRRHRCKPSVIMNKLPTDYWYQSTPEQRQWVVANYLLYRESPAMLESTGRKDYAGFNEIPEMSADLGTAITPPVRRGPILWTRLYRDGITIVNPSSAQPSTVDLPAGTYTDLHGVHYTGTITVPANTGLVLKRS